MKLPLKHYLSLFKLFFNMACFLKIFDFFCVIKRAIFVL